MINTDNLKTLPIVASVITIANFIVSLNFPIDTNNGIALSNALGSLSANSIILRIIIFLILEFLLSLAIVKLMLHIANNIDGSFSWFGVIILAIVSAWTSIFNCKYIFLSNVNISSDNIGLFKMITGLVVANLLFAGVSSSEEESDDSFTPVFVAHGIVLVITFLLIYYGEEI